MQDHQKNRERWTFALTNVPPRQVFRDSPSRKRRKTRQYPPSPAGKSLEIDAFCPHLSRPSMFSTVFSTVVEILGNKPKVLRETDSCRANRKPGL